MHNAVIFTNRIDGSEVKVSIDQAKNYQNIGPNDLPSYLEVEHDADAAIEHNLAVEAPTYCTTKFHECKSAHLAGTQEIRYSISVPYLDGFQIAIRCFHKIQRKPWKDTPKQIDLNNSFDNKVIAKVANEHRTTNKEILERLAILRKDSTKTPKIEIIDNLEDEKWRDRIAGLMSDFEVQVGLQVLGAKGDLAKLLREIDAACSEIPSSEQVVYFDGSLDGHSEADIQARDARQLAVYQAKEKQALASANTKLAKGASVDDLIEEELLAKISEPDAEQGLLDTLKAKLNRLRGE